MDIESAEKRLADPDALSRFGALAALREAAEGGKDISAAEGAIVKALSDSDDDVRQKAARLLASFYGERGEWGKLDGILGNPRGDVRASAIGAICRFAGAFDIRKDAPALVKAIDDHDFDVRSEAASFFEKAAAAGQDISFAIPALNRAAAHGDDRVKKSVANAIRAGELRSAGGGKCAKCLDCETGFGPGNAAKCFEDIAAIIKSISCCQGDVTHRVFRCAGCGKNYLSTYFDHSDSSHGQLTISQVGIEDAARIAAEFRKCPAPEWRLCKCDVHVSYLKEERVPVKGLLKYNAEDKD